MDILEQLKFDLEMQLAILDEKIAEQNRISDSVFKIEVNDSSDVEFINSIVDYCQDSVKVDELCKKKVLLAVLKNVKDYLKEKNVVCTKYGKDTCYFDEEDKVSHMLNYEFEYEL